MGSVTQLNLIQDTDRTADLAAFDEFWKWYPHNPQRRSKAKARQLFLDITAPGGFATRSKNKDAGNFISLHHQPTAQEIVDGAKEYRDSLIPQQIGEYSPDTRFVENATVWLNAGDWER